MATDPIPQYDTQHQTTYLSICKLNRHTKGLNVFYRSMSVSIRVCILMMNVHIKPENDKRKK
jgi:hypothetical protein